MLFSYNNSMKFKLKEVDYIFKKFDEHGYECFLVGGCTRNLILSVPIKDYDFTTNAPPQVVEEIFKGETVVETGLKHGTVTVVLNKIPFEITTYRIDGEYLDSRRPESVSFTTDLKEDLIRRDFTMNSIAYNPKIGYVDIFGGQEDIKNKIIRCNGIPDKRFNEDALRILRAIRFASVLGFSIEEETKKSMFRNKDLLKNISHERVAAELNGMLVGDYAHKIMFEYIDILGVVVPELLPMKNFEQRNPNHLYDVLKHTCVALEGAEKSLVNRLTILFHDIGKPSCFSFKDGVGHFYGHADASEEIAKNIMNRLKYDNKTKNEVLKLVKYHDIVLLDTEKHVRKLVLKHGFDFVKKLVTFQRADNHGQGRVHIERIEKFNNIDKIIKDLEENGNAFTLKDLKVKGGDLIEYGFKGPAIGKKLNEILLMVATNQMPNKKKDIIDWIERNKKS